MTIDWRSMPDAPDAAPADTGAAPPPLTPPLSTAAPDAGAPPPAPTGQIKWRDMPEAGAPPGGAKPEELSAAPWGAVPYDQTDAIAHGLTFGYSDALKAGLHMLHTGQSWSDAYANVKLARQQYETEHPVANALGNIGGALVTMRPGGAAGIMAPTAAETSVLGNIAKSSLIGGGLGGAQGAAENLESPEAAAKGAATGSLWGGATGTVLGTVGSFLPNLWRLGRSVFNPAGAAPEDALRQLQTQIQAGTSAGGPDIPAISTALQDTPGAFIGDVGGRRVQRYMRTLAGSESEAPEILQTAYGARDEGANTRLTQGTILHMTPGTNLSASTTEADLIAQQQAKATPLYNAAIYDQSGAPRQITDPAVMDYVTKSAPIRNAIDYARAARPDWANLPDTDMRLLDAAYKSVGRKAWAAQQPGDVGAAQSGFRDALVNANPDYGSALAAWAGDERAQEALQAGRGIYGREPEESAAMMKNLTPDQRDLYLIGARQAVTNKIDVAGGGNEANAILRNERTRKQMRTLFDSDDAFNDYLDQVVKPEDTFFRTRQATGLSSQQIPPLPHEPSALAQAAPMIGGSLAGGGGLHGAGMIALGAATKPIWGRISEALSGTPESQAVAARMLSTADPAAQSAILDWLSNVPPAHTASYRLPLTVALAARPDVYAALPKDSQYRSGLPSY